MVDAAPAVSDVAHSPQNLTVGSFAAPHVGHAITSGAAHSPQNLRPAVFALPQFEQITTTLTWERQSLLGVLDGARLADDGDLDLARVGQLLLDLLDDVAGQPRCRQVVDLLGPDEDAHLAPGLDGE